MAEIRVERKKASPWTWMIGLLLLVLLLWGVTRLLGTGGAPDVRNEATPVGALPQGNPAPAAKPPAVPVLPAPGERDAADPDSDHAEALRLRSRMVA